MCEKEFWVCDCKCHTIPNTNHCMPCCEICPNCEVRIKISEIENHKKECLPSNIVKDDGHNEPLCSQDDNDGAC